MKHLPSIKVDEAYELHPTPPRIVLVTCEKCGCNSGKVADAKPAACQFCGSMPRKWWQAAYDCAPPQAKEAERKRRRGVSK